MASTPSLKATVFQVILDELSQLLCSGRISQAELERKLDPGDLKYLGKSLAPSSWVPIAVSTRLLQLLFELSGRSDLREYMRERGRVNAQRLKEAGLYPQFEVAAGREMTQRAGRTAVTLSSLMLSFTRWSFETGEDVRFRIIVDDAADYPDVNRFAAEGFIEQFVWNLPQAGKVRVDSERVAPDRVVFTATED